MKLPAVYVDPCIFLAHFSGNRYSKDIDAGIEELVRLVDRGDLIVATSALTRLEVVPARLKPKQADQFDRWLQRRLVVQIETSPHIVDRAAALQDLCLQDKPPRSIKPFDSLHLATALVYRIPTFYTLDGASIGRPSKKLLGLNGHVATAPLKICVPPPPREPKLPLQPPSRAPRPGKTRPAPPASL